MGAGQRRSVADVAIDLDLAHYVIPNMRSADAATIQLPRQLAVHLAPRFTDAGPQIALQRIDEIGEFPGVVPVLPKTSNRQYFWDALVVLAAQVSGAEVLYSEDLSDGQQYGPVRVVNPLIDRPARI